MDCLDDDLEDGELRCDDDELQTLKLDASSSSSSSIPSSETSTFQTRDFSSESSSFASSSIPIPIPIPHFSSVIDPLDSLTEIVMSHSAIQDNFNTVSQYFGPLPVPSAKAFFNSRLKLFECMRSFSKDYFHPLDWMQNLQPEERPKVFTAQSNRKKKAVRTTELDAIRFFVRRSLQYPHWYPARLLKLVWQKQDSCA